MLWDPTRAPSGVVDGVVIWQLETLQTAAGEHYLDDITTPTFSDGFEDGDVSGWVEEASVGSSDLQASTTSPKTGSWHATLTTDEGYQTSNSHSATSGSGPYEFWIKTQSVAGIPSDTYLGFYDDQYKSSADLSDFSATGTLFGWKIIDSDAGFRPRPYGRQNGTQSKSVSLSTGTYYRPRIDNVDFSAGTFDWEIQDSTGSPLDNGSHQFAP
jgi:hypothetical protein